MSHVLTLDSLGRRCRSADSYQRADTHISANGSKDITGFLHVEDHDRQIIVHAK